jgi:hypothetical protein
LGEDVFGVAPTAAVSAGRVKQMDSLYPLVVAAPVIGLAAYCVSQIVVARLSPGASPYRSLSLGFMCGLLVMGGLVGWAVLQMAVPTADRLGYAVLDLLTYLALAFGYFNFVNLTVASLRIRLLEELLEAGGMLPADALMAAYDSRQVVAIRLERLIRGGHLVENAGRLHIGRLPFLIVARIFDGLRWVIIGRGRTCRS